MKHLGLLLGLILSLNLAQAQEQVTSVNTIPIKDDLFENTVTVEEFNTIVNTLRGLYSFFTEGTLRLGINEPQPASNLTLDVGGRVGAESFCDENGEHCIDPSTWDARPQLELNPPGATCAIAYQVKDQKYESEWQETNLAEDPIGAVARFNSGLKNNCSGEGCGVRLRLRCEPNLAVTQAASCRLRYRVNHLKQSTLNPWVTTSYTQGDTWQEGPWSTVLAENTGWGDGLNLQAGIECTQKALRCQIGYRLHNEAERPDWKLSPLTSGAGWQDAEPSLLSANVVRACDQRQGCGLQMQSRCTGTTSTLKTQIFACPRQSDEGCPTLCTGQLSLEDRCNYQQRGEDDTCNLLLTEPCDPVGHLVQ